MSSIWVLIIASQRSLWEVRIWLNWTQSLTTLLSAMRAVTPLTAPRSLNLKLLWWEHGKQRLPQIRRSHQSYGLAQILRTLPQLSDTNDATLRAIKHPSPTPRPNLPPSRMRIKMTTMITKTTQTMIFFKTVIKRLVYTMTSKMDRARLICQSCLSMAPTMVVSSVWARINLDPIFPDELTTRKLAS